MNKKVLIIAAALVLALGTAVGVGAYFVIQSLSHPPEDTAKFLPMETTFYVSMNLRPGVEQIMKAKEVRDRFREDPRFGEKLDEIYEEIEEETGINMEEDLFPWMGPEVSLAIPDFQGIDEAPGIVAFIGTTDKAAAESLIRKLIAEAESEGVEYEEGETQGHLTFISGPSDEIVSYIALTDDYIVATTSAELLESTLDRMNSAQDRPSLLDKPGFQEARAAAQSPRFGILYLDVAAIIDRLGEDFDEQDFGSLKLLDDQVPDFIVASAAFVDKGIRVSTSFNTPDQWPVSASANSVGSAARAPENTLGLLSFVGIQDAWKKLKDEINDIEGVEEGLEEIESELGIDIEEDIFDWMSGELAVAMLLPGGASFGLDEIHANVYVEFDDRAKALSGLEDIRASLEQQGAEFTDVDIEGVDAVVAKSDEDDGLLGLSPGYLVLDNYVVIGTTKASLQQAVAAKRGDIPSLLETSAFSRPLEAAEGSTDFLIYANIKKIVKAGLDQVSETDREQYEEEAAPFVQPLEAFLFGVSTDDDISTFSTVITIE